MNKGYFFITLYIAIAISGWSENGMFLQNYERIYSKKL